MHFAVVPRSHLHVKSRPVGATLDNFREIEWDAAISYFHGSYGVCVSVMPYGVYVPLFLAKIALCEAIYNKTDFRDCVTVA